MKELLQIPFEYYKDLRWNNLKSAKYKHLLLLLYWPFYGLLFLTLERICPVVWRFFTGEEFFYHEVVSSTDALIPFCEWFVIPYYFWFVFLVGMGIYSLLFDIQAFRQFMWYIILTYSITSVIYIIYPTCQNLRPEAFPRDNWMVDIVKGLYNFDTNTNVCPSIHVLGSLAVCFPGLHSKYLKGWGWKVFFIVSTVLISVSTVFMKQHSIIDVYVALILGAVCYPLVYGWLCKQPKGSTATAP